MSGSDRELIAGLKEISILADRLNLSTRIVDQINNLFKLVHQPSCKHKLKYARACACLYITCRQEGVPRTLKEISAISKTSKKKIIRCFRSIIITHGISLNSTTADFISRFCANLDLPIMVERAAEHIARKFGEMDLVRGRSPITVAAAAIYMASEATEHKRGKTKIGDIANVSDTALRQTYQLMYPHAYKMFPEDFKFIEMLPNA